MNARRQRGFTLIEMMIGIVIGLFGLLAITEVLVDFNVNRNAVTQTMESQNNGTMALYLMERDLLKAGYGMMNIQDCSNINWYFNSAVQTPLTTLPVKITDGGAASDSIEVQYANSSAGVPATLISQAQNTYADPLSVASVVGLASGNLVIADAGGVCTLYGVTAVNNVSGALSHASTSAYNPASDPGNGWDPVPVSSTLVNLGSNFVDRRYGITANALATASFPSYASSTSVDGIVFMKAQYGRDTNGDGTVDTWSAGTWVPDNSTANQIVAVRIGVVARSLETIAGVAPSSITLLPELKDLTGVSIGARVDYTLPDRNYRYKAYSTIIPLRNVIWSK